MKKVTVEIDDDEVLVALRRCEGYEDVHSELLAEDAMGETAFEYRVVEIAKETPCQFASRPQECYRPQCQAGACTDPDAAYPKDTP